MLAKNPSKVKPTVQDIWKNFSETLRKFIIRRIADQDDVDDILQEIFIKIHKNIETVQDEKQLTSWLFQISRNSIIDYYRVKKRQYILPDESKIEYETTNDEVSSQLVKGLRYLTSSLPKKYQEAIELSEFQGVSQKELAKRLGISISGAKSRVQRGRRLLRTALLNCCHLDYDHRGYPIDIEPSHKCVCFNKHTSDADKK